jgi:hypothetical protein
VRETILINSRLAWRRHRGDAAVQRRHGLLVLSIELLAARLAGGFLQPINSDALKVGIAKALDTDLDDLNAIKSLPGFPRAAAATLRKTWAAGIDLALPPDTDQMDAVRRHASIARLETEVLRHIPPSMQRPIDLVTAALTRLEHAARLFGRISVHGHTEMAPVWRPLLAELIRAADVRWVAGPRHVPPWVRELGIPTIECSPKTPNIECRSCASPRHEALEALRWARGLIAGGRARPEEIAIAAASPEDWDDHFLALSEMSGLDLHFAHGRKVLLTAEGQLAAALAEVLLRGFSQARMTRLVGLLRNQNPAFENIPRDWWRILPKDAPLLDVARWREVIETSNHCDGDNGAQVQLILRDLIDTLALGLKRATEIGEHVLLKRSLAIWRKALTEGPPEALDLTLPTLRLPDQLPQESTIVWAPAASLAAEPRHYVWLIGLTSRAWPRRQTEDPLLPDHIVRSALLDPLPVHEADRRDFATIMKTTALEMICSHARREAQGRINGVSPLYPKSCPETHHQRARVPEHACGWTDRLFARPTEFQALPTAQSAIACWINWHTPRLTSHDGLIRASHPLVVAALDRTQSTTSLAKLLRDPLAYLWTYGFRWEEPQETEEPLLLDAPAFGSLLHATLEAAVTHLETALPGGLRAADKTAIAAALDVAIDAVSVDWVRRCPVPPPIIWRRVLQNVRALAVGALTFRENPLTGQLSWAEVRFGSDPTHEALPADAATRLPWNPCTPVVIPGTTVAIGGSIDRLDLSGCKTNARLTDYKSGKAPGKTSQPVLKGGAELQRCLYAYAVTSLVPGVEQVEARLLFPKKADGGLYVLSDPHEVLKQLACFIGAAQDHALAGDLLPGVGAQDSFNDLAFALPGGAKEAYFEIKRDLIGHRLGGIAPLWEMP